MVNDWHGWQMTDKRKYIQFGKEEIKMSLLPDDTIIYVENTKESEQKDLKLNSARLQDMRSIGKPTTCLYANENVKTKIKIRDNNIHNHFKKMKYLDINLIKQIKNLYTKN